MTTTSAPEKGATDPDRSPSAGIEFRMPTNPEASDDVTQTDEPPSPPDASTRASGDGKPPGGRRRKKSTRELLAAHRENQTIREELEAEVRKRRSSLETECYSLLGAALFARRGDAPVADLYQVITSALGARAKTKLEELGQLHAICE